MTLSPGNTEELLHFVQVRFGLLAFLFKLTPFEDLHGVFFHFFRSFFTQIVKLYLFVIMVGQVIIDMSITDFL